MPSLVPNLLPALPAARRPLLPSDFANRLRALVIAFGAVVGISVGVALLRAIHGLTGTPSLPGLVFGGAVILAAYALVGGLLVAVCLPDDPSMP